MKLLANENFPYKSIIYLREKGFDIISIGMDNPRITDKEVMKIAIKDERTILTFDRDYGELIFKFDYRPEKGVIYLRLDEFAADEPGIYIEELINSNRYSFEKALTVFDRSGIRQRKY